MEKLPNINITNILSDDDYGNVNDFYNLNPYLSEYDLNQIKSSCIGTVFKMSTGGSRVKTYYQVDDIDTKPIWYYTINVPCKIVMMDIRQLGDKFYLLKVSLIYNLLEHNYFFMAFIDCSYFSLQNTLNYLHHNFDYIIDKYLEKYGARQN